MSNSSSAVAECVCGDPQCEKTCPSSFPTLMVAILGSGLSLFILGIIFMVCTVAVYKYRSTRGERLDRQELMQEVEDEDDEEKVELIGPDRCI